VGGQSDHLAGLSVSIPSIGSQWKEIGMFPECMKKLLRFSLIFASVISLTLGVALNVVLNHPFWVIYDFLVGLNGLYFAIAIL
jgi:hypothetical protein